MEHIRPTRSCGCLKSRIKFETIPLFVWSAIRNRARNRNISFEIEREQVEDLYKKQGGRCSLSGLSISFAKKRKEKSTASVDRIDSSKGYSLDNIQLVDKRINNMKQSFSQNEFIKMCKLIAENVK